MEKGKETESASVATPGPKEQGEDSDNPPSSIAVAGAVADATVSPLDSTKKRKATDLGHAASQSWRQHFEVLEEWNYSKSGKK